ncbi:MAG: response regulator [Pseudomonadota bacterium]
MPINVATMAKSNLGHQLARGYNAGALEQHVAYRALAKLDRALLRYDRAVGKLAQTMPGQPPVFDFVASDALTRALIDFDGHDGLRTPYHDLFADADLDEFRKHRLALAPILRGIRFGQFDQAQAELWRVAAMLAILDPIMTDPKSPFQNTLINPKPLQYLIHGLIGISVLMLLIMWLAWRVTQRSMRAEASLHAAINAIGKGFIVLDEDERVVLANQEYHELYGFEQPIKPGTDYRAVLRHSVLMIQQFEDMALDLDEGCAPADIEAIIDLRLDRLRSHHGEWEQQHKDGRILLVRDAPIPGGGYVSLRTDITKLKDIEHRLRRQLRAMDLTTDAIAMCDQDGRYTYANQAFVQLHGLDRQDQILGQPWHYNYDERERGRFTTHVMPVLFNTTHWRDEVTMKRADGEYLVQEVTINLLPTGETICVARDIRDRRQAEEERDELQQQVYQAQKMEAVGRLAGGIAHDFNNILSSILGYATLLEQDLPPNSDHHHFAESIRLSGERAASLVSQILAFSRTQENNDERLINLGDTVSEVSRMLQATLPKTIALTHHTASDLPLVLASATRLNQVVMNLCVNAADAMVEQTGCIDIQLTPCSGPVIDAMLGEATAPYQTLNTDPNRGRSRLVASAWRQDMAVRADDMTAVKIEVSDTGQGIDPDILPQIFEPFFTTKAVDKGTGLGLAAVHGIVMAAGGILVVETEPGQGTSFQIILPGHDAQQRENQVSKRRISLPAGSGLVLVVDDDETLAAYLSTLLQRQGYDVIIFNRGQAAIDHLADPATAEPDVLITDQTMPGVTGLDVVRAAREYSAFCKIILCTGYSDVVDKERAIRYGADHFLTKPVSPQDLLCCVQSNAGVTKVSA